jgi:hypothetical protein
MEQTAYSYFSSRIRDEKQLSRLVAAAPHFINPTTPDVAILQSILSGTGPRNTGLGLRSILEIREKVKRAQSIIDIFTQIILFYELECPRVSTSQSQAIAEVSHRVGVEKASLTASANKGRIYRELLIKAGPGDLIFLSGNKRCWERFVNVGDVPYLLDFRRSKYSDVEEKIRSFDWIVAGLISSCLPPDSERQGSNNGAVVTALKRHTTDLQGQPPVESPDDGYAEFTEVPDSYLDHWEPTSSEGWYLPPVTTAAFSGEFAGSDCNSFGNNLF